MEVEEEEEERVGWEGVEGAIQNEGGENSVEMDKTGFWL